MATVWGVPVSSLYQHVLSFYRKEKEQIRLEYSQRMELLALFKQVKVGPYSPDKDSDTGYFDVVGADRRKAWIALGSTSREEAQCRVVQLLEGACPQLKEVVLKEWKEEERLREQRKPEKKSHDQLPSPEQNGTREKSKEVVNSVSPDAVRTNPVVSPPQPKPQPHVVPHTTAIAPAALWCTPKAARHFIAQLAGTAPLTLAPEESLAVQVPTSPQATALFWEFVTESGDIGFGLSFQRGKQLDRLLPVTVRDCSQDLVLGRHHYQEQGIYVLEFSNSHSTLPKIVHYRVFYQTS